MNSSNVITDIKEFIDQTFHFHATFGFSYVYPDDYHVKLRQCFDNVRFESKKYIIEDMCGFDNSLNDVKVNESISILYDVQNTYDFEVEF